MYTFQHGGKMLFWEKPPFSRICSELTCICRKCYFLLKILCIHKCQLKTATVSNINYKTQLKGYCHALLQEIFLTQGSNPCLLHWQACALPLCCPGSPMYQEQLPSYVLFAVYINGIKSFFFFSNIWDVFIIFKNSILRFWRELFHRSKILWKWFQLINIFLSSTI